MNSKLSSLFLACLTTTALTGGVLAFSSIESAAACVDNAGVYTCSGELTTSQIIDGEEDALEVNTAPGFSITATGDALGLYSESNITFTDLNNSAITGTLKGIDVQLEGGATIITTGTVTGQGSIGIDVLTGTSGYGVILDAQGDVFGQTNGLDIDQVSNDGNLSITTSGTVTGFTSTGITATNAGNNMTIIANGNVIGGSNGIEVINSGIGVLSITTEGAVVGGETGIIALNDGGSDLIINAKGDVSGGEYGLQLTQNGVGNVIITTAGTVTGTSINGINVETNQDATGVELNSSGNVVGGQNGINIIHQGSGDLSITTETTATITGMSSAGINAQNYADNLIINTQGNVTGRQEGIKVENFGVGDLSITADGNITGENNAGIDAVNNGVNLIINAAGDVSGNDYGINAENSGSGDLTITTSGTVTGQEGTGIYASNDGVNLTINTSGDVLGDEAGISASQQGSGDLTITTSGVVTGGTGIDAETGLSAVKLIINTNDAVVGAETGINANHQGSGALEITTTSTVTGAEGTGILADIDGLATDLIINAQGAVLGGENGIYAYHNGSGNLNITTTGTVTGTNEAGIYAENNADSLTITANEAVIGGEQGISATNNGSGALTITTEGEVTGGNLGIYAVNNGTDLTINTKGIVSGDSAGIQAEQNSNGNLQITTEGMVRATSGNAIDALTDVDASDLTINAKGDLSGGINGIKVVHSSQGNVSISTAATVTGVDGSGIFLTLGANNNNPDANHNITITENSVVEGSRQGIEISGNGDLITITNDGMIRNSSDLSDDGALSVYNKIHLVNNNQITGRIEFGDGGSVFDNNGIWLTSGDNQFSETSNTFSNNTSGTLLLDGSTTLSNVGIFNNAGSIEFIAPVGDPLISSSYKTLTIAGDYVGTGGNIILNTYLDAQDSPTDQLIIDGGVASGITTLHINNTGGNGALVNGEGIKVVDTINGATTDADAFLLAGQMVTSSGEQAVVSGAYAYTLHHNGVANPQDGNWYLRSELIQDEPDIPLYQGGVPTYEAYPQALLGLNGLSTLQQRVGNRMWAGKGNRVIAQGADTITAYAPIEETGVAIEGTGIWGRIDGAHNKTNTRFSTSDTDYEQNVLKLQAGIDGLLNETENGKLIGGITIHYTHGKTNTKSVYGDGKISTNGYGFGGTLTWYDENGFYLDGQGQVTWYRSDLTSSLVTEALKDGSHGFGYALSAEAGKRFTINEGLSLTPQAQLIYSNVRFSDFTDVFDAEVSLDRGQSLQGRVGLAIDRENSWQNAAGMINRSKIYGIANLYYEFLNGTRVDVSGTSFASQQERFWGGVGIGGSYNWDNDQYSVFGEVNTKTSFKNFGDSYSVGGNVGFRVKW
ncbi:autotransporter outer membrane beta-barrel domain-containing protein [Brucellaceae bacterium C25G]